LIGVLAKRRLRAPLTGETRKPDLGNASGGNANVLSGYSSFIFPPPFLSAFYKLRGVHIEEGLSSGFPEEKAPDCVSIGPSHRLPIPGASSHPSPVWISNVTKSVRYLHFRRDVPSRWTHFFLDVAFPKSRPHR
jgi:hypothetical protein